MTEVLHTNIIYDKDAAIAEVARVNVEQPIQNKQNKTFNTWFAIILSCIPVSSGILSVWLFVHQKLLGLQHPVLMCGILLTIAAFVAHSFYEEYKRDVLPTYQWYSANAEYWRVTDGSTILKHDLIPEGNEQYTLHMEMEDESHVVFDDFVLFPQLQGETRTDITEVTVDLIKGKVYFPYKSK